MAALNIGDLFVSLRADTSGLNKGMKEATSSVEKGVASMTRALMKFGVAFSAGAFLRSVITNSVEAQNALAQLGAVVTSTGGAAGKSVADLTAHANALQKVSTFSDEAIEGAQGLLLTFTQIKGDTFDRATEAVLDLATAMGGDLKGASIQVGKALNDPVKGITALTRVGVTFTAAQKEIIKNLVETGHVAEAQAVILKELQTEFGGSAKAARMTLGGALQALSNAWGEALEVSADASSGMVGGINGIAAAIPHVRKVVDVFFMGIQRAGSLAAVGVEKLKVAWLEFRSAANQADMTERIAWGGVDDATMQDFNKKQAELDKRIVDTKAFVEQLKVAADEVWDEMLKESAYVPPAMKKIDTALHGLTDEATKVGATIGHSLSDFAKGGGMGKPNLGSVPPLLEKIKAPLIAVGVSARDADTAVADLGDQLIETAFRGGDAFVSFATGAKDAFSDFVRSAIRDLGRLLAKMLLVQTLKSALNFGVFGGGGFAHGLMDLLDTRASGGPVRAGKPYLVGERGPEMFVPSASGAIIPNGGGGGAALLSSLPPIPRPMSPNEAAIHVWYREAFALLQRDHAQRSS